MTSKCAERAGACAVDTDGHHKRMEPVGGPAGRPRIRPRPKRMWQHTTSAADIESDSQARLEQRLIYTCTHILHVCTVVYSSCMYVYSYSRISIIHASPYEVFSLPSPRSPLHCCSIYRCACKREWVCCCLLLCCASHHAVWQHLYIIIDRVALPLSAGPTRAGKDTRQQILFL